MTVRLDKIDSLFPTPLVHFTVDDHAALNAQLLHEVAARRATEDGVKRTNVKGWHSASDLFERREPAQARIAEIIKQAVAVATRKLAPNAPVETFELVCEGWINVNPSGGYNAPHAHHGSFWSGTYYVANAGGTGGAGTGGGIEFLAPHRLATPGGLIKAPMTAGKALFRPQAGTLLLFPSNLMHWVHPNDSAQERVTIAFNASVRPISPAGAARPRS